MIWSAAQMEQLTTLDEAGYSAAKIADELGEGLSRSAVLGKLHRIRGKGAPARSPTQTRAVHPNSLWQPEKLTLFHELYERRLGDDAIAAALGRPFTRVIVKSKRTHLRLPGHFASVTAPRPAKPKRYLSAIVIPPRAPEPTDNPARMLTIHELRESSCRWPLGDPGDLDTFRYCGAEQTTRGRPTAAGFGSTASPYCRAHHRLAYNAGAM